MNFLHDVLSETGIIDAFRLDSDLTDLEDETVIRPTAIELLGAIQLPPRDGEVPDSIMIAWCDGFRVLLWWTMLLIVRALKFCFIAHPINSSIPFLMIHDFQNWKRLMILKFGNLCVTTSTCTRTLVDTYMPFCDDNEFLHLNRMMILNFEYLYGTFTCTRTIVDACTSFSMIKISCTWAERWFSILNYLYGTFMGIVR